MKNNRIKTTKTNSINITFTINFNTAKIIKKMINCNTLTLINIINNYIINIIN